MERGFRELFGDSPQARGEAPGRVNLIGEHTDYNGGYVLPVPIPQRTLVEVAARGSGKARAWSASFPENHPAEFAVGQERPGRGWLDYVQAIPWALSREGIPVPAFDARIVSSVPLGGGLASSASLEVALLRAMRNLLDLALSDREIARIAHAAETGFAGVPAGVMDQMICSLGSPGSALWIDTRSLDTRTVALPASVELGVLDSGVRHSHAAGEYRVRRAECEEAARRLGVESLRDLEGSPPSVWENLEEPLNRRVRHVVTENGRVRETVRALEARDTAALGGLLAASHRSLRDDYEVSSPELDTLVELAAAEKAIFGARLTGGGFGGSVVLIGKAGETLEAARRIVGAYRERTGRDGQVVLPLG